MWWHCQGQWCKLCRKIIPMRHVWTLDASWGTTSFSNLSLFKIEECLNCSETNLRCRDVSEHRFRYCEISVIWRKQRLINNCSSFFPVWCVKGLFQFSATYFATFGKLVLCASVFLTVSLKVLVLVKSQTKCFWEMFSTLKSSYPIKILILSSNCIFFLMEL